MRSQKSRPKTSIAKARALAESSARDLDARDGKPDFSTPLPPAPELLNGDPKMTIQAQAHKK